MGRVDQGIDIEAGQANVGKPIVAMGKAVVVSITSDPGGFGRYIAYRLLDGPAKGRVVYVGHSDPVTGIQVGDRLSPGEPVALIKGFYATPGHIEMGWADSAHPNIPLAQMGSKQRSGSPEGQDFLDFFNGGSTTNTSTDNAPAPVAPVTPATPAPTASDLVSQDMAAINQNLLEPKVNAAVITPAQTWQTLAQLPGASPDTLRLAQYASQ